MDITSVFGTFAAIVADVPVITQAIKKLIKKEIPGWANQLISWGVSILVCFFGWFFDLGFLADINWWQTLIIGFGTGLAANGVYDIEIIKQILGIIFGKINKNQ